MKPTSPAYSDSDLLDNLSQALHTTPMMSRLHDPDCVLSKETARQLVDNLQSGGIALKMAVPNYAVEDGSSSTINNGPIPANREIERLRQEQDDYLDEALQETFPASDPIAPGHPHPKIAG